MHPSDQYPPEGEASHSSHAVPPTSVMSSAYPSRRITRRPNTRLHGTCHPTTRFDRPHFQIWANNVCGVIARHVVFPVVSPTPFGLPPYQLSLQMPVSLNVDLRLSRSRLSQGESTRTWHTELVVVLRGRKEVAQTVGCTSLGDINRVRREKRPLSDPLHRSGY